MLDVSLFLIYLFVFIIFRRRANLVVWLVGDDLED